MQTVKPVSRESQVVQNEVAALLDLWEQELRALIEIRCARHGRESEGPSFSVVLVSLAILEALLTIFEWDPSIRNSDQLGPNWLEARTQLGDDYAKHLWDTYRNGLAHLFVPKQKGNLAYSVVWAERGARPCVDDRQRPEFFVVAGRLRPPEENQRAGRFTIYAANLAKAVLETIGEKRNVLQAASFDMQIGTPGWKAWNKQVSSVQRLRQGDVPAYKRMEPARR